MHTMSDGALQQKTLSTNADAVPFESEAG